MEATVHALFAALRVDITLVCAVDLLNLANEAQHRSAHL